MWEALPFPPQLPANARYHAANAVARPTGAVLDPAPVNGGQTDDRGWRPPSRHSTIGRVGLHFSCIAVPPIDFPNCWHRLLLRERRERPRRRAAEERDERASSNHSITSSASARIRGGNSKFIAFAALRLITSSNLVGWMTGKSAGFSPLRMRPA